MSRASLTVVAHEVRTGGGMENVTRQTVIALLEAGHHVHVYSKVCDLEGVNGLSWRRVPTPRRPFMLSYPLFAIVAGLRLLIDRPPRPWIGMGANVFNRMDVVTVHYLHAAAARHRFKRSAGASAAHRLNSAFGTWMSTCMERWCYSAGRTARFTAVSDLVAQELVSSFDISPDRVLTIPNGVDLEAFQPSDAARAQVRGHLGIDPCAKLAIFVGGDWDRKGLSIAVEATARAHWSLLVVGDGDRSPWLADKREDEERLIFVGRQPQHETARYLAAADALLLPSSYEPFGLVVLEAAATGTLPVVSEMTGARDVAIAVGIQPARLSAEDFAERLRGIAADSDGGMTLRERAREVAERYAWTGIRARYVTALSSGRPAYLNGVITQASDPGARLFPDCQQSPTEAERPSGSA